MVEDLSNDPLSPSLVLDRANKAYAVWMENASSIHFSYRPADGSWASRSQVTSNISGKDYPCIALEDR